MLADLRMKEDVLDWRENQRRSTGDVRRTDLAFVGLTLLGVGILVVAAVTCLHWLRG
jgi:hypothetical protein